jgi:FAD/FMN-containing dehydrogenase
VAALGGAGPIGAARNFRVGPFSTGRSYINFQTADEDEQRIRAAYGANFERLTKAKKAYDPDNAFRTNRNITPSA